MLEKKEEEEKATITFYDETCKTRETNLRLCILNQTSDLKIPIYKS